MEITKLTRQIHDSLDCHDPEIIISKFKFENLIENELLFFFKPECFFSNEETQIKAIIEMVLRKFKTFKVDIAGMLLLGGKRIEQLAIMDRHYGFINKLSKCAGKILTEKDIEKIKLSLGLSGLSGLEKYTILGGHEFLEQYPEFDEQKLNEFWLAKHSLKLRSGFYFQEYEINNQPVILINGFHPSQLRHFTNPHHKIVVLLLKSDTDWKILKNDLAGDTFPEKAKENSIRGDIFRNSSKYGIQDISISRNCVHLSAGPFEALFEIDNFLKNIREVKYELGQTNIARLMEQHSLKKEEIAQCLANPTAQFDSKLIDLFTFTEEKNSREAISEYQKYFRK
ncbi:MAG TPA: hypothetical protein VK186_03850 [Candidatus Deferrimicrobium sp.]|nr:hypothetical protein [Candidatus Deferrimicrobium sp.]